MNILIDKLPKTVEIDRVETEIQSDFRTSILFESLMKDKTIRDEVKIELALNLYFPNLYIINKSGAINQIMWFYVCGKEIKPSKKTSGKQIYDFEQDADYIYAAFMEQYKIDLVDIGYLHWWKFKSLFTALNKDILMSKIMMYRGMTIDQDMSKAEKKFYKEMKQLYRLEDNLTEEEKEMQFNNSFSGMF